jgi:hypothetical protein
VQLHQQQQLAQWGRCDVQFAPGSVLYPPRLHPLLLLLLLAHPLLLLL